MSDTFPKLSRRGLLTGAIGTAAAASLSSGLASPVSAKAPMMGGLRQGFYRFKLGGFEVTTIYDGAVNVPKVHPIFGNNQKLDDVQSHMAANNLPGDKMMIPFTPVIVNTGKEVILFDAGNGAARRGKGAGLLASQLASAGFTADQIDIVAITHCHPDHIGGLMEGGKPLFSNARYVCGSTEYNFWSKKEHVESSNAKMASRAKLVQNNVVSLADKMTFIKPGEDVVTGVTSVGCFGHTPGHMAYHLQSGGKRFLVWGDVANHYVASVQKPEWHVIFDMDKEMAIESRKKILGMVAADKIPAAGYHMPFPAAGFVEQKGDGFRWVPASYQLDL